jgi:hypothetical protein
MTANGFLIAGPPYIRSWQRLFDFGMGAILETIFRKRFAVLMPRWRFFR